VSRRDQYRGFAELADSEREGHDYRRRLEDRGSGIVIVALHGGGIEPGTSEIAEALAGEEFSLYCFEGIRRGGNDKLHITSTRFDEPMCIRLVEQSDTVVAVHGLVSANEKVYIGGLDDDLRVQVVAALERAGFRAEEDNSRHSGSYRGNVCNRGASGRGLQLEVSEGLRRAMFRGLNRRDRQITLPAFDEFVAAVRGVLLRVSEERETG